MDELKDPKLTLDSPLSLSERKPVDPPPIIQLKIKEENSYLAQ